MVKSFFKEEMEERPIRVMRMLFLCIGGIIINFSGARLASTLGLPFYFDAIGTVLAAAIGGYLPGILVGLVTNVIIQFSDNTSLYYGSLNVMIAVVTAYYYRNHKLEKIQGVLKYVLLLSMIGGLLGGLITWALYGVESKQVSAGVATLIYENLIGSYFGAELAASWVLDICDKSITAGILMLVLKILPKSFPEKCRFDGWQQRPLSEEARIEANKGRFRKVSLRFKLLVVLLTASCAIAIAATGISFAIYRNETIKNHADLGAAIAKVAASFIPPGRVGEYIEKQDETAGYAAVKTRLYAVREGSEDIRYIYVYKIEEDGFRVLFDLDTAETKGAAPGTLLPFKESQEAYKDALLAGERIDPIVTKEADGWLLTVYEPVFDTRGSCVCYVGVDMWMPDLVAEEYAFFAKLLSLFLGFFVLVVGAGLWIAEYNIVLPMNTMAISANAFAYDSEEKRTESIDRIRNLDIHTGDEIENLYQTLIKTSTDSLDYVDRLSYQNEAIEKMQNGLIVVLAEMVENRDHNTGQHVRKTAAYVDVIMQQMKKEGIYVDRLTDRFVHDVCKSAPLHDVGKINIPDAILNKPGKLTEEEFAVMKTHTTAGRDIISKVIEIVPETGYLEEARNLAAHHHERWDGKGYPDGLAGEEIPLSARIMAVADVFDALVSKRSYKPGFPFDKALAIINEGIGTQFDPLVVQAFMHVSDEVKKIADEFGEME